MSENINQKLMGLKGFTFDGDTGRTLSNLQAEVDALGYTRDNPFAGPAWRGDTERPLVVNSYLDQEGKRIHLIWGSDKSGLSRVVDVILDAPSLLTKKERASCGTCGMCGCDCGISEEPENDV
ncbi:MAG: hypothetical protein PHY28_02385 [Dehalococcoidales bacterium]|nr:hypothetical protein [Dehalococcoidales bacterium]